MLASIYRAAILYFKMGGGGGGVLPGKYLCLTMWEGRGEEEVWWYKQIKKITKETSHFVCSISCYTITK